MAAPLPIPILVGTHHKTGTVWMQRTFRRIAEAIRRTFIDLSRNMPISPGGILFHMHSEFPAEVLATGFRGLHVIRDPRDIVISGLRYHRDAREPWLHTAVPQFGGLSYQEKLNSLSPDDQFVFELEHSARRTLGGILAWRYDDKRFFEARYEALHADRSGTLFATIAGHLQFNPVEAAAAIAVFTRTTIAGKPVPPGHPHIRSGEPAQWRRSWRRWQGERFLAVHGDCLVRLRYESDDGWLDDLPP
jgi:hypothetical protein